MTTAEHLLADIAAAALERRGREGWRQRPGATWCHVGPPVPTERVQGWKLHVSATPLSAPTVLGAAADVLVAAGCPFKYAPDLTRVEELTSVRADRAQAGKFITAYPSDDAHLLAIAQKLHDATLGLPGPRILSDRPFVPGSLVHLRYGAFRGVPTLTDDGGFEARLAAPDGSSVEDRRLPWFAPPSWATLPDGLAPLPDEPAGDTSPAGLPLLAGRYEISAAIRHSARGGVFRARDLNEGTDVVIKQARPHIGGRRDGRDARDQLAHEEQVLRELAPLTPRPLDRVTVADDVFLVEEFVPGRSLAEHVADVIQPDPDGTIAHATELARALIALVAAVHRRGRVLRDLSTTNVMVRPDGRLVLIDPEYAARPGEIVQRAVTPGFAPPEVTAGDVYAAAPGPAADRYAVGAALVQLALGAPPMLLRDDDDVRTSEQRVAAQLATATERPLVRRWRPLLLGLTAQDPDSRWTLERADDYLAKPARGTEHPPSTSPPDELDRVLTDGLAHLLDTRQPEGPWLWPADAFGTGTDPLNVQYGAAGVLAVLTRAARHDLVDPADVASTARWVADRVGQAPRLLPGLHFGRGGTVVALTGAAALLQDESLLDAARALAARLPATAANPDVCHGTAGAGLAALALGDTDRVVACAEHLVATAHHRDDGVFWPVPDEADSRLAGAWHYGFGHGVAGVGAFLLEAAHNTGEQRYRDLALAAARTLAGAAEHDPRTGGVTWRPDRNLPATDQDMRLHWCSGASGIGTFLVRVHRDDPDGPWQHLVDGAAEAVHHGRFSSGTAACHGLAGDAQFLLDAGHRQRALDLADVLLSRHARRRGRLVLPDESGLRIVAGYGTGLAGGLDLLLRLRFGGGRLWYPDAAPAGVLVTDGRR